jgi:hypothetical protein
MAIIAEHCLPTGWRGRSTPHDLVCEWPQDCYVQWGGKGLVLCSGGGSYVTAFFEAFPTDPPTFLRGEGATVEEAERMAFAKLQRQLGCPAHEFERGRYRNGAALCKHCGLFNSVAFEPLDRCVVCDAATSYSYGVDSSGREHWYCEADADRRCKVTHPNPLDRLLAED